jgi:hypothetical protein
MVSLLITRSRQVCYVACDLLNCLLRLESNHEMITEAGLLIKCFKFKFAALSDGPTRADAAHLLIQRMRSAELAPVVLMNSSARSLFLAGGPFSVETNSDRICSPPEYLKV